MNALVELTRPPVAGPAAPLAVSATRLRRAFAGREILAELDLTIRAGEFVALLGASGSGKTTLLRILAGLERPDTGNVNAVHGIKLGYYAQEHATLDLTRTVVENLRTAAPELTDTQVRSVLGSFLFSGEDADKPASVLSGGEKTRLALAVLVVSAANVLLLDEPTNNLDPASREQILGALRSFTGSVVLVSHDEGAVAALDPERVLLLPDGSEDYFGPDYLDLVALA